MVELILQLGRDRSSEVVVETSSFPFCKNIYLGSLFIAPVKAAQLSSRGEEDVRGS